MREHLLRLGLGLSGPGPAPQAVLGEGSVNFYLDEDGYLVNYPGRTDWFRRPADPPSSLGTPPATTTKITRVLTFRDVRGKEHIVFVRGNKLCETLGNGYRELYTFLGVTYEDGLFFPDLFVHEAKLIIVNFGDPVLMWDGRKNVHPLGVQETPLPPDPRTGDAPYTLHGVVGPYTSKAYGAWQYKTFNWPGKKPTSGPGSNLGADGTTKVWGVYQCVVQFFDEYGNHGPVSSPSRLIQVKPNITVSSPAGDPINEYSDTPEWESSTYLTVDWYPPQTEDHIVGCRIGRTLSQNSDGGAGVPGVYWTDVIVTNTTTGRATLLASDGVLAAGTLIDTVVHGPTQASGGCSAQGRIFLWGHEDPFVVTMSDVGLFGQYRDEFRAHDHVKRVIALGDRTVVISRSSTEVLYENSGAMALLEQDFANGSIYGRSFVDVGGAIFGLWNRGFGFYDGQKHEYVEAPYFLEGEYLDSKFYVHAATVYQDWYLVSIRKDAVTPENNYLLAFHLRYRQWYLLEEKVYDLTVWQGAVLGCEDSLYELFKGPFPAEAVLYVKDLIPEGDSPLYQRNLQDLRLLMESSSVDTLDLEVEGEFAQEEQPGTAGLTTMPSRQSAGARSYPVPYWNPKFLYADEPPWAAPRDVWIGAYLQQPVPGYLHSVRLTFPSGHLVRLRALGLTFGEPLRSAVR